MQRVGILGGTFDPPHIGHLILGEYTAEALELDCLLFVPAADPPHKQEQRKTAVHHRLAMVEIALADNPHFQLSQVDMERSGPHYSVDMVRIIQQQYPGAELYFVMGGDSLRDLPKWNQPEVLIELCKLAVMRRPGDNVTPDMHQAVLPTLAERVVMIDAPVLEISSSQITQRIRDHRSVRYVVPDAVLAYIHENKLYRNRI